MDAKKSRINAPFHAMTEAIARDWYQRGHLTTTGYILAIKGILKPFSDCFEIENVSTFCEEWGIKRPSFYRAISKLKAGDEIDWKATTNITITTLDTDKVINLSHKRNIKISTARDSSEYQAFLNSDYWRDVRKLVLERDSYTCQECESKLSLHVHHLTYEHHGDELNHLEDLVVLCKTCHADAHGIDSDG